MNGGSHVPWILGAGIIAVVLLQFLSGDGPLVWGSGVPSRPLRNRLVSETWRQASCWPSMLGLTSSHWVIWGSEWAVALGPSLSEAPHVLAPLADKSPAMVQTRIWIPVGEAVQLLVTGSGGRTGSAGPRLVQSESGGSTRHWGEEGWGDRASSSGSGEPCDSISS